MEYSDIWENQTLKSIAYKYGKFIIQILLRWYIKRNVIILPKSVYKECMKNNIQIFDFELSKEDIQCINKLDKGKSVIYDKYEFII